MKFRWLIAFAAGLTLLGSSVLPIAVRAQTQSRSCAIPDTDVKVIKLIQPPIPSEAAKQKLYGAAAVLITIDANSHVIDAAIAHSASPLFNDAALKTARDSIFQTAVKNCVPIGGRFEIMVQFFGPPPMADYLIGTWSCTSNSGVTSTLKYSLEVNGALYGNRLDDARGTNSVNERFIALGEDTLFQSGRSGHFDERGTAESDTSPRIIFAGTRDAATIADPTLAFRYTLDEVDRVHLTGTYESGASSKTLAVDDVEHCTRQ